MKLNFYRADGTRSSVTLDDKLLDVWALTIEDEPEPVEAVLRNRVLPEAMKAKAGTLTGNVEWLLLDEVAEALKRG